MILLSSSFVAVHGLVHSATARDRGNCSFLLNITTCPASFLSHIHLVSSRIAYHEELFALRRLEILLMIHQAGNEDSDSKRIIDIYDS